MPVEQWQPSKLGDYAKITMGQSLKPGYYSGDSSLTPFLQGNRTFGMKYPTFDTYTVKVIKRAPKGSVLVSVRAPVGDVNLSSTELCIGRGLASLMSSDVNNEYLYYLMKNLKPVFNQNENGSIFGSINRRDIENVSILLPSIEERNMIGRVLSNIDAKIENNCKINDNLIG